MWRRRRRRLDGVEDDEERLRADGRAAVDLILDGEQDSKRRSVGPLVEPYIAHPGYCRTAS
jgi:hypothetical protein